MQGLVNGRNPSFSPDGKMLAYDHVGFSGRPAVYLIGSDGTGRHRLVTGVDPVWAPGGDVIAFTSAYVRDPNIWTVRPDGSHLRRVTLGRGARRAPDFSPDGSRIVFEQGGVRQGKRGAIYTMALDGSRKRKLRGSGHAVAPTYSPNGKSIAALRYINDQARDILIWRSERSRPRVIRRPTWDWWVSGIAWQPLRRR